MSFDLDVAIANLPEPDDYEPIPEGTYQAHIIEATTSVPKSGNGKMLKLLWEIVSGEYEKRRIYQYVCYEHSNPDTQRFAQQMLKSICWALGMFDGSLKDTDKLIFQPMSVKVGISKGDGDFGPSNKIKRVIIPKDAPRAANDNTAAANDNAPAPKIKKPWHTERGAA
jgi:hypothetical protein